MLIINFEEGQGLGNQLWNYASIRSLSDKLGCNYFVKNYDNFKAKDFIDLDIGRSDNSFNLTHFNERLYFDNDLRYISSGFDERVLNIDLNQSIIFNGLFQDERYFFNNFSNVTKYFSSYIDREYLIANMYDRCVLNIRGGEYKKYSDFMLSKNYWNNAIDFFKNNYLINEFIIVTDDYLYAKKLFPKLAIISENIKGCFDAIYSSKYLVSSNSTFSYFPSLLSRSDKIIIGPMYWARPRNNLNRWCSVGNVYENWIYMNDSGNVISYLEAVNLAKATEDYYNYSYSVCCARHLVSDKKWFNYLPSFLKRFIKVVLANYA